MSKDRTLCNARKQHWYGLVKQELDRLQIADWRIAAPTGKGHPKLIVNHDGRVLKTPVPSSERGGGDHKYLVARIRKAFGGSDGQGR